MITKSSSGCILTRRFHTRIITFVALLCFLTSCHSKDSTRTDESSVPLPHDFRIVIGEGGGFTGLWNGHTVDSTGTVFTWRGAMAEENAKKTGTLSQRRLNELWQSINRERFFEVDTSGTGNMTVLFVITANGRVHRNSWAKAASSLPRATQLEQLYEFCRSLISEGN